MYFAISYNTKTNKYHQQKKTKLFSFSYSSRCSLFHFS
ncbi:hypothetical protein ECTW09195_0821 [Escherichia coli TW09195]|nr:hypothetical protein ECTW09195_0821 [Escherichia coli TW09195]EKH09817.1 hypothetical protein ECFRIK920_0840 [Escherichia coli FRIK920]EKW19154.1 hypothetical protein EC930055_0795 [Escherichia coli 93.0055]ELV60413.1 hypothetical protein EC991775_0779 [Escherichia coli 99.1775]ERC86148.1 hypothetical protein ECT23400_0812 [Escherichia coli T234_00]ERD19322.1 hypothetical protein S3C_0911 [Escherichia coli B105]